MKTKMIFNLYQANLFIQYGASVVGVGYGKRHKIYLLFEVTPHFEDLLERWNNHEFLR